MDIKVLEHLVDTENQQLLDAVDDSSTTLDAALGVARILIANNGDTSVLKGKQNYVFEKCIEPLFHVPCEGIYGEDTCRGTGEVDEESLLVSYQEERFLCQWCRLDSDKIDAE